jgi:hypothetical protein
MDGSGAEQSNQSDDYQIDRNDVVQKPRHDQDQYAGEQRDERADTQVQVHRWFQSGEQRKGDQRGSFRVVAGTDVQQFAEPWWLTTRSTMRPPAARVCALAHTLHPGR